MGSHRRKQTLAQQRGSSMLEYALVIALVALIAYVPAHALGGRVRTYFVKPTQCLSGSSQCGVGASGGSSGS
jgi:Flp pilus assembly pilin Flp